MRPTTIAPSLSPKPVTKRNVDFECDTREKLEEKWLQFIRNLMPDSPNRESAVRALLEGSVKDDSKIPVVMIRELIDVCFAGPFRIL